MEKKLKFEGVAVVGSSEAGIMRDNRSYCTNISSTSNLFNLCPSVELCEVAVKYHV